MGTDVDRLLGQARWVEAFARALVREDAEDVAQDAWLAAIQHPPEATASPRPWFATVMRNLKRMQFRSASRRRAREDASATAAAVPTPAELAHRMELQRRLASAVVALDEPQRTTVVLVFYEGLSPAEVARKHGVPATTVRSRLRAALVTLRVRLDAEEDGDRARWHLALAPIAAPKFIPATTSLASFAVAAGALLVTAFLVIAIAVQRDAPRAEVHRSAAIALARTEPGRWTPSRTPAPPSLGSAASPANVTPRADLPPAFVRAEQTLMTHVDECYEIAHRVGRDLKGVVQLTIALDPTPLGVTTRVEVDSERTTITDPAFLECIHENAMAIEDQLERMHAQGEPLENLRVHVVREMPPHAESAELVTLSSAGGETPSCPEGTVLGGTQGVHQWCALPDGTKHGLAWRWDEQGRATVRASYDHGTSSMELTTGDERE